MKKTIDMSHIYTKKYENKWVAITKDYKKVISSSASFNTLHKRVGNNGITYLRVPSLSKTYAF